MPDTNTILKYLKVRALAEGGSGGERANARRIAGKMEKDYPGLKEAAGRYVRAAQSPGAGEGPPGVWPKGGKEGAPGTSGFPFVGNWEQIFNFARDVVDNAYDFANTVADAYMGRALADEVDSSIRVSRAGNLLLTFKMSLWVYQSVRDLNLVQKEAFRQAMHERLDDELTELLGLDED